MTWIGRVGVLAGVFVTVGCNSEPIFGPPPPLPAPFMAPPIRGTVREVNGGPVVDIGVQMTGAARVLWANSDAQGVFLFPYSSNPCDAGRSVGFEFDYSDYRFDYLLQSPAVACTNVSSPPEVGVELKVQPYAWVGVGRPLETMLTNDDLNWPIGEAGEGPCGPCKVVALVLPSRASTLSLDWSGPDRLQVWVTGWDVYANIILAQQAAAAGDHQLKVPLPAPRAGLTGITLKVGAISRLSDASALRIDLR